MPKDDRSSPLSATEAADLEYIKRRGFASKAEYDQAYADCARLADRAADLVQGVLAPDVDAIRALIHDLGPFVCQWASKYELQPRRRRPARVSPFCVLEGGRPGGGR